MTNNNTQKVYEVLIKIFGGVELASLKAFFLNVIKWNVDVVVFTTRRSHLLYCLFKKYVITSQEFNQNNFSLEKKYITDKAIPFYNKDIKEKTVLVVDDILVHGRALASVVEKIAACAPKQIEQYIFAQSKNITTKIEDESKNICKIKCKKGELDSHQWKRLSNQIVASLVLSSIPYASYIFSINRDMEENEFEQFVGEFKRVFVKDTKQDYALDLSLNEYGNNSELTKLLRDNITAYIFPVDKNRNDCFSYIRLYYNKITKNCIIMPFYFMSAHTEEDLDKLYSNLLINPKFQFVDKEMIYRALTAFYSLLVLKDVEVKNIISKYDNWGSSKEIVEQSYYKDFYDDVINLLKKDILFPPRQNIIKDKAEIYGYVALDFKQVPIDVDVYLNEFIEITDSFDMKCDSKNHSIQTIFLHTYLKNVNEKEEEYIEYCKTAEKKAQQQEGLSFEFVELLVNINGLGCTFTDILSKTISGADSGLITISPNKFKFKNKIYYSNFLITGEQVCRLYQNEILIFLLNLQYMLELTPNSPSIEEFVEKNIKHISSDNKKRDEILDCAKKMMFVDSFTKNNIYEKIYDKELRMFLEKLM